MYPRQVLVPEMRDGSERRGFGAAPRFASYFGWGA